MNKLTKKLMDIKRRLFPDRYYSSLIIATKNAYHDERKKVKTDHQNSYASEASEIRMLQDEWDEYKSDGILKIAKKYDLYIPPFRENDIETDFWDKSYYDTLFLSSKGRDFIRKEYREEIKWKREKFSFYISIFIGLIGSLTGLFAIILKINLTPASTL